MYKDISCDHNLTHFENLEIQSTIPFVSVITVCKNAEKVIGKTLQSLLMQNYSNYELLIQDGASTDNTLEVVECFEKQFKKRGNTVLLSSEPDAGIYNAMNKAVRKASGKYVIFMNAGDEFAHDSVMKNIFIAYEKEQADIYYGDSIMVDGMNMSLFKADMNLLKRMPFCHQACFTKKQLLLDHTFDETYKIIADYDMILRFRELEYVFKYVPTIVCKYDMSGISSTKFVRKRLEHEKILTRHNLGGIWSYIVHLSEAIVKTIAIKLVPQFAMKKIKEIYLSKVKKYNSWNGVMY